MPLDTFHPAVANWFRRTFAAPTPAQAEAWPAIRSGRNTLIAAPTGSGKTLAAFLAAIDDLVRRGVEQPLPDETAVVYVSPLKALSNDMRINLEAPLAGIRDELLQLWLPDVEIRTMVRTGDTPQAERDKMRKRPPHIVVTTPESLYILLGSESGRRMLSTTRTVIVDEVARARAEQARQPSRAVARTARCAVRATRDAHRSVGDAEADRGSRALPDRRRRSAADRGPDRAADRERRCVGESASAELIADCKIVDIGHVARARSRARTAGRAARSGHVRRRLGAGLHAARSAGRASTTRR